MVSIREQAASSHWSSSCYFWGWLRNVSHFATISYSTLMSGGAGGDRTQKFLDQVFNYSSSLPLPLFLHHSGLNSIRDQFRIRKLADVYRLKSAEKFVTEAKNFERRVRRITFDLT